jgi:hypothetical protein
VEYNRVILYSKATNEVANQGKKGGVCTVLRHCFGDPRRRWCGGRDFGIFRATYRGRGELAALSDPKKWAGGAILLQGKMEF